MRTFIRRLFIPAGLEPDATPRQRKWLLINMYAASIGYAYYSLKNTIRDDVQGPFSLWEYFTKDPSSANLNDTTTPLVSAEDLQRDWVRSLRDDPTTAHLVAAPEEE